MHHSLFMGLFYACILAIEKMAWTMDILYVRKNYVMVSCACVYQMKLLDEHLVMDDVDPLYYATAVSCV